MSYHESDLKILDLINQQTKAIDAILNRVIQLETQVRDLTSVVRSLAVQSMGQSPRPFTDLHRELYGESEQ
jgi:hypothetical protein